MMSLIDPQLIPRRIFHFSIFVINHIYFYENYLSRACMHIRTYMCVPLLRKRLINFRQLPDTNWYVIECHVSNTLVDRSVTLACMHACIHSLAQKFNELKKKNILALAFVRNVRFAYIPNIRTYVRNTKKWIRSFLGPGPGNKLNKVMVFPPLLCVIRARCLFTHPGDIGAGKKQTDSSGYFKRPDCMGGQVWGRKAVNQKSKKENTVNR